MATKGGRIDFMFLGPPYPATGSVTGSDGNLHLKTLNVCMNVMICIAHDQKGHNVQFYIKEISTETRV